jgi:ferritin-like metal-binding protein YciE
MTSQAERLARMEVEVKALKDSFEEHKAETNRRLETLDEKLDQLLELRNKGAGVLWLLGGIISTGVIGGLWQLFHFFGAK